MEFNEVEWSGVDRSYLEKDLHQWRTQVNMVMKFWTYKRQVISWSPELQWVISSQDFLLFIMTMLLNDISASRSWNSSV
jgi:hypothetical protein